jgi:hypothetical protein
MKRLLVGLALLGFTSSFAAATDDLKIALGQSDKCYGKAFRATKPSDEQKESAQAVHEAIKKVFEDNKSAMEAAASDYMAAMMNHPIVMDEAVAAAHALGEAVHPVQAAIFTGAITIVNLLSADQRAIFDRVIHRCMKD